MKSLNIISMIGDNTITTSIPIKKDKGISIVVEDDIYKILNGKKVVNMIASYNLGLILLLDYDSMTYEIIGRSSKYEFIFGNNNFLKKYKGKKTRFDENFFSSSSERGFHNINKQEGECEK